MIASALAATAQGPEAWLGEGVDPRDCPKKGWLSDSASAPIVDRTQEISARDKGASYRLLDSAGNGEERRRVVMNGWVIRGWGRQAPWAVAGYVGNQGPGEEGRCEGRASGAVSMPAPLTTLEFRSRHTPSCRSDALNTPLHCILAL
jgi:hypothetical protein